jgi:diguanylate cyclase
MNLFVEAVGAFVASDAAYTEQLLASSTQLEALIATGEPKPLAECLGEELVRLHRTCEARRRVQAAQLAQLRARVGELVERVGVVVQRSRQDSLTGLAARAAWEERMLELPEELAQGAGRALALIDVDHFKRINDDHGHPAGDRALRTLAALCARAFGGDDFVARYGGDEVAVLITAPTLVHAVAHCERLLAGVRRLSGRGRRSNDPPPFTLSIGLALAQPAEQVPELLARADAALYAAKRAGRDRLAVASTMPGALRRPAADGQCQVSPISCFPRANALGSASST